MERAAIGRAHRFLASTALSPEITRQTVEFIDGRFLAFMPCATRR
jgi:hypothetical protein